MFVAGCIGLKDFIADTAALDPKVMLASLPFPFLSLHLDKVVSSFHLAEILFFSSFPIYLSHFIGHKLRHERPTNPSVIARMESNGTRVDFEEAGYP